MGQKEGSLNQPRPVDEVSVWQLVVVECIFAALAAGIIYNRHSLGQIVWALPIAAQTVLGILIGSVTGSLIGALLLRSRLRESVVRGVMPLGRVAGAVWSIVLVSLFAGVGEEFLFRAALQPWLGMGWAALLFGVAHSGTARLQEGLGPGKAAYLLATVGIGLLLGLLYRAAGLLACIAAHASFDIGILTVLAPAVANIEKNGIHRRDG
jgi:membrane protease YdiL (CAAX protease family)